MARQRLFDSHEIMGLFIIVCFESTVLATKPHNATLTNLSKCKLTQLGTEYMGSTMTTAGGIRCQSWHSEQPLHKVSEGIKDTDFPERSIKLARNYCRNPTKDPRGPWCYTMEPTLIDDACEVPLCNYGECRISGTGAEYGGSHNTGSSGRKCKSWDKRFKLAEFKTEKFPNNHFSDLTRNKAKNSCRNPDDSTGGPWCYVEADNYDVVEKEYCNIPFCDDQDCIVYTKNASVYSTITSLNASLGNITFWIKLWNPSDEQKGEARLLLSLLPTPDSAERIAQNWRAGVEIVISNAGSGQAYPHTDDQDFEDTPNIIVGSKWTGLWVSWGGGFVSVGHNGSVKPIFLDEFKKKKTISSLYPESFLYYGLMGTGVLWTMQFCEGTCDVLTTFGVEFINVWPMVQSNSSFDVKFHVRASHNAAVRLYQSPAAPFPTITVMIGDSDTTTIIYQEKETSGKEYLKDVPSPKMLNFWAWEEFTISIFGSELQVFWTRDYGNQEVLLVNHHGIRTLRWFSIGSEQTIAHWTLFCAPPESAAVEDPWFPNCISSSTDYRYEGSQWTSENEVPCVPWIADEIPEEFKKDELFVSGSALKSINKCRNPTKDPKGPFCFARSFEENSVSVSKRYCPIRHCRSSECRMAGTANDYIGTLSVTRSGRTCGSWVCSEIPPTITANKSLSEPKRNGTRNSTRTRRKDDVITKDITSTVRSETIGMTNEPITIIVSVQPETIGDTITPKANGATVKSETIEVTVKPETTVVTVTPKTIEAPVKPDAIVVSNSSNVNSERIQIHKVNPAYLNDTLFPERSAFNASNYCRDPSRNIAGTWCYTTDPEVPQDLCNVRDCIKPEECTFFVRGHGMGRRLYVLPEYRSEGLHFALKEWEPDRPDSITFVFLGDDGFKSRYILKVGAMENEKVLLYYESETQGIKLVKKKTLPHLLYLGKWSGFVVRIPRGRVEVYYEGSPYPLFDWAHPEPAKAFLPIYYYYTSELGYTIGVSFDCHSRCHIENTKTDRFTRILPISLWEPEETPNPKKLVLMIRGRGVILIPLLLLPSTPGYYGLTIGEAGQWILFIRNVLPNVQIFHKQKAPGPLFTTNTWTNLTIEWIDKTIKIFSNGSEIFLYRHKTPLLFYFFSLAVDPGGWATWTANCMPIDIDGAPQDGGWSEWGPWACSAKCGGGMGTRKRVCNAPEPNVRGEPCLGPSTSSGRCNTNVCGDISDDTIALIRRKIRRNHTALTIKEGEPVTIHSDPDVIEPITTESPESEINWSHNGIFVQEEEKRIEIKNYDIIISSAILNDSGVYTITLHRVDGSHMIFKVITLAVEPVKDVVTIRETLPFAVMCHCIVLGYVYSDLKISWTIGEKLWKSYGTTLPVAVNIDHLPAVNRSHNGQWKCIVEQNDLGFTWTTNMVAIKVIGPPNWRTHLMEDKLTRPIFGWMPSEYFVVVATTVLFLLIISCIVAGLVAYLRFQESLKYKNPKEIISGKHKDSRNEARYERLIGDVKPKAPKKIENTTNAESTSESENEKTTGSLIYKAAKTMRSSKIEESTNESDSEQLVDRMKNKTLKNKKPSKSEESTSELEDTKLIDSVKDKVLYRMKLRDSRNSNKESDDHKLVQKLKTTDLKKIKPSRYKESTGGSENTKLFERPKDKAINKMERDENEDSTNESDDEPLVQRLKTKKIKPSRDVESISESEHTKLIDKLKTNAPRKIKPSEYEESTNESDIGRQKDEAPKKIKPGENEDSTNESDDETLVHKWKTKALKKIKPSKNEESSGESDTMKLIGRLKDKALKKIKPGEKEDSINESDDETLVQKWKTKALKKIKPSKYEESTDESDNTKLIGRLKDKALKKIKPGKKEDSTNESDDETLVQKLKTKALKKIKPSKNEESSGESDDRKLIGRLKDEALEKMKPGKREVSTNESDDETLVQKLKTKALKKIKPSKNEESSGESDNRKLIGRLKDKALKKMKPVKRGDSTNESDDETLVRKLKTKALKKIKPSKNEESTAQSNYPKLIGRSKDEAAQKKKPGKNEDSTNESDHETLAHRLKTKAIEKIKSKARKKLKGSKNTGPAKK